MQRQFDKLHPAFMVPCPDDPALFNGYGTDLIRYEDTDAYDASEGEFAIR